MARNEGEKIVGVRPTDAALAADLEKWGKDSGCDDDPVVKRIVRALRTRQDGANWATLDFFTVLPTPKVGDSKSLWRWVRRVLEALRGTLVFVPVLKTWYDLRAITQEYREEVSVSDSEVSFLVFWAENGLPTTALWVVAAIGLAIVLGLGLDLLAESTSQPSHEVDKGRRDLAVRLTDAFRPKQKVDLTNLERSLVNTIDKFDASASTIRDTTERMREVWSSTASLSSELEKVSEGMTGIAEQISGAMAQSIAKLHKEVASLADNIAQIERKMTDQVDVRIDEVSKKLVGAAAGIEESQRTIQLVINAIYDELSQVHADPARLSREKDLPRSGQYPYELKPYDVGSDGSDRGNEL